MAKKSAIQKNLNKEKQVKKPKVQESKKSLDPKKDKVEKKIKKKYVYPCRY